MMARDAKPPCFCTAPLRPGTEKSVECALYQVDSTKPTSSSKPHAFPPALPHLVTSKGWAVVLATAAQGHACGVGELVLALEVELRGGWRARTTVGLELKTSAAEAAIPRLISARGRLIVLRASRFSLLLCGSS